jgi:hypothetical protein
MEQKQQATKAVRYVLHGWHNKKRFRAQFDTLSDLARVAGQWCDSHPGDFNIVAEVYYR